MSSNLDNNTVSLVKTIASNGVFNGLTILITLTTIIHAFILDQMDGGFLYQTLKLLTIPHGLLLIILWAKTSYRINTRQKPYIKLLLGMGIFILFMIISNITPQLFPQYVFDRSPAVLVGGLTGWILGALVTSMDS